MGIAIISIFKCRSFHTCLWFFSNFTFGDVSRAVLVIIWHHFLTRFCICSHLWFSWFLTTLPIENSFFTGLTASLLTHFVLIFSTSFQVSFLTWFSQLLKPFRCPFCSKNNKKQLVEKLGFLAAKKEPPKLFFTFLNAFWNHFWEPFARL